MLRRAGLEAAAKACGLRDVRVGAKLSLNGEQRLGQPVAKDADVNCILKVEECDEQAQAVATDLERMRVRVVVEGGNHSEELCKVWFTPFEHDVCEPPNAPDQRPGAKEVRIETETLSPGSLHLVCWTIWSSQSIPVCVKANSDPRIVDVPEIHKQEIACWRIAVIGRDVGRRRMWRSKRAEGIWRVHLQLICNGREVAPRYLKRGNGGSVQNRNPRVASANKMRR